MLQRVVVITSESVKYLLAYAKESGAAYSVQAFLICCGRNG
jgi:hypothetical protein